MNRTTVFLTLGTWMLYLNSASLAQQPMNTKGSLDTKQQAIVTISAFTANGDMPKLQAALSTGLDAGLSINELKEILVQLLLIPDFPVA